MAHEGILARVMRVTRQDLEPKRKLTTETDFRRDLGADELDMTQISLLVEKGWEWGMGVSLNDDDLDAIKTIGDMVRCYEQKLVRAQYATTSGTPN